ESDETNNTATTNFTVTGLADLVAGAVMVMPATPTARQAVGLSASVTNSGTVAANGIGWQLTVDGAVVGSGTIASLAAGANAPVSAVNLGPYAQGPHTAVLDVDFANAIAESNEGNNIASQGFTVGPAPVDLVAGT